MSLNSYILDFHYLNMKDLIKEFSKECGLSYRYDHVGFLIDTGDYFTHKLSGKIYKVPINIFISDGNRMLCESQCRFKEEIKIFTLKQPELKFGLVKPVINYKFLDHQIFTLATCEEDDLFYFNILKKLKIKRIITYKGFNKLIFLRNLQSFDICFSNIIDLKELIYEFIKCFCFFRSYHITKRQIFLSLKDININNIPYEIRDIAQAGIGWSFSDDDAIAELLLKTEKEKLNNFKNVIDNNILIINEFILKYKFKIEYINEVLLFEVLINLYYEIKSHLEQSSARSP